MQIKKSAGTICAGEADYQPTVMDVRSAVMGVRSKAPRKRGRERRASVDYIGSMSRELAAMARNEGCGLLSYMLEVAAIEAERMGGAGGAAEGQSAS